MSLTGILLGPRRLALIRSVKFSVNNFGIQRFSVDDARFGL